jgi:hypothetical protein
VIWKPAAAGVTSFRDHININYKLYILPKYTTMKKLGSLENTKKFMGGPVSPKMDLEPMDPGPGGSAPERAGLTKKIGQKKKQFAFALDKFN